MRRPNRRLDFQLERLEARQLLAGDVTAALTNLGDLRIDGDKLDNDVSISFNGDQVKVTGNNGTTINGNDSEVFSSIGLRDIRAKMKRGVDIVSISDVNVDRDVSIDLGRGSNGATQQLEITGNIAGDLKIDGSSNEDSVRLGYNTEPAGNHGITVGGRTDIRLKGADDILDVSTFGGNGVGLPTFKIDAGTGADEIAISDISVANLDVRLGNGGSIGPQTLSLSGNIEGKLTIVGGNQSDSVRLGYSTESAGNHGVRVGGRTDIRLKGADDVLDISSQSTFAGSVKANGGRSGSDQISADAEFANDPVFAKFELQATPIDLSLNVDFVGQQVVGAEETFSINLANNSATDATGVEVFAPLPSGYAFVSSSSGGSSIGEYDETTGVWNVGEIEPGIAYLSITATPLEAGDYEFVAELIAADQPDVDSTPGNSDPSEDDQHSRTFAAVPAGIDLRLDVYSFSEPGEFLAGTDVVFDVELSNSSPTGTDATGVAVLAPLPSGYAFVSSSGNGEYDETTGVWNVGEIEYGVAYLTIRGTALETGDYEFVAEVSAADQPDVDSTPGNNDPSEDDQLSLTIPPAQPGIDLEWFFFPLDQAFVGDEVEVHLTLWNSSLSGMNATGVEVLAPLPSGYAFVSSRGVDYNAATGIWDVGGLASDSGVTLSITAIVLERGDYEFVAEVTAADQSDQDSTPGNNDPSEDDQVSVVFAPFIDLELIASAYGPDYQPLVPDGEVLVGSEVEFSVIVDSYWQDPARTGATGVEVLVPLPSGYAFVSSRGTGGEYDDATGVWDIGDLDHDEYAWIRIRATVLETGDYEVAAEVLAADQPDVDSSVGNNDPSEDDQDSVSVVSTTLSPLGTDLALSLSGRDRAVVGDGVTFFIGVGNSSPTGTDATGVEVLASLPSGYAFVEAELWGGGEYGEYDEATGVWDVGDLNVDSDAYLEITATVLETGEYEFVAEVSASDQPDVDSTAGNSDPSEDDQDSVTLDVVPQSIGIDLSLNVSRFEYFPPFVGEQVEFVLGLGNSSRSSLDATGIEVLAPLPSGYAFVSASAIDGEYDDATGVWNVDHLSDIDSTSLRITATVIETGDHEFVVEVIAADQPDEDSTAGNNDPSEDDQDSVTLEPVVPIIDLSLDAQLDSLSPLVGDEVEFSIELSNSSPANASGVEVLAPLPSGYAFVSSSINIGEYDETTGVWDVVSVNSDGIPWYTPPLTITAVVLDSGDYELVAQVSAADQLDVDSTPGNNDPSEDDWVSVVATPQLPGIDLGLIATVSDSTPLVGDEVEFSLELSNSSPTVATGVEVLAPLPSGYSFVGSSGDYDAITGVWDAGLVSLDKELTVTATVLDSGDYELVAEVIAADQPDVDSTPGNNDPSEDDWVSIVTTPEVPVIDLGIIVDVNDSTPLVGDEVAFVIKLSNSSPTGSAATGVEVLAPLPSGYKFQSSNGDYDATTGVWDAGVVKPEKELIITALVLDTGDYELIAEVIAADQLDVDSTPGNNHPSEDDQGSAVTTPGRGSIWVQIWDDLNSNGGPDIDEPLMEGVTVILNKGQSTEQTYVTDDGNGADAFTDLPLGTYTLTVDESTLPAGYELTYDWDEDGTLDGTTLVTLLFDGHDTLRSFGYGVLPEFNIDGQIWLDNNQNGLFDVATESEFEDFLTVELSTVDGGVTTFVDSAILEYDSTTYLFADLDPTKQYVIEFIVGFGNGTQFSTYVGPDTGQVDSDVNAMGVSGILVSSATVDAGIYYV